MKILKTGSSQIALLALIAGALTLWHFYIQQTQMFSTSPPIYDRRYGAAIEALGLISCITMVLSNCLRKIEKRLEKLEKHKEPL